MREACTRGGLDQNATLDDGGFGVRIVGDRAAVRYTIEVDAAQAAAGGAGGGGGNSPAVSIDIDWDAAAPAGALTLDAVRATRIPELFAGVKQAGITRPVPGFVCSDRSDLKRYFSRCFS